MAVMPARETEQAKAEAETTTEAPAPAPAEKEEQFTAEGDLPAVAQPGLAVATGATASEIAFDGKEAQVAPDASHLDKGVHQWEAYKAACEQAGKADKWQDHYRNGYTSATQWEQPYENRRVNDFILNPHTSASRALEDFLKGPTICDFRTALVADEINQVRLELGDQTFDKLFGSENKHEDSTIPAGQRLRISSDMYTTPIGDQMRAIAAKSEVDAAAQAEPAPAAELEARVEEKPKSAEIEQDPLVVAQELGIEQRDREII